METGVYTWGVIRNSVPPPPGRALAVAVVPGGLPGPPGGGGHRPLRGRLAPGLSEGPPVPRSGPHMGPQGRGAGGGGHCFGDPRGGGTHPSVSSLRPPSFFSSDSGMTTTTPVSLRYGFPRLPSWPRRGGPPLGQPPGGGRLLYLRRRMAPSAGIYLLFFIARFFVETLVFFFICSSLLFC